MNLTKLKELCANATPGPWYFMDDSPYIHCGEKKKPWNTTVVGRFDYSIQDANFVQKFNPTFVSKLLAVVEAAKYEVNWGRCRKELTAAIAALEDEE